MAAGDRIIRLTYEELHDLAQKYKKSTMDTAEDEKHKKHKRPDRALYQTPGRMAKSSTSSSGGKRSIKSNDIINDDQSVSQQTIQSKSMSDEVYIKRQLPDVVSDIGMNSLSPLLFVSASTSTVVENSSNNAAPCDNSAVKSESLLSLNPPSSSLNGNSNFGAASLREHLARSSATPSKDLAVQSLVSATKFTDASLADSGGDLMKSSENNLEQPKMALGRGRNRTKSTPDIKNPGYHSTKTQSLSSVHNTNSNVDSKPTLTDQDRSTQLCTYFRNASGAAAKVEMNKQVNSPNITKPTDNNLVPCENKPSNIIAKPELVLPDKVAPLVQNVYSISLQEKESDDITIKKYIDTMYNSLDDEKYVPDKEVEESVNMRTFQGLVFTSNRPTDKKQQSPALANIEDKKEETKLHVKKITHNTAVNVKEDKVTDAKKTDIIKNKQSALKQEVSKKNVTYDLSSGKDSRKINEGPELNNVDDNKAKKQGRNTTRVTPERPSAPINSSNERRSKNNFEHLSVPSVVESKPTQKAIDVKNDTPQSFSNFEEHKILNAKVDKKKGDEKEWPQSAKGGGILHLPPTQMKQMTSQADVLQTRSRSSNVQIVQAPSSNARGPTGRTLYDPNSSESRGSPMTDSHNSDSPKQLHFVETGDLKMSQEFVPPYGNYYGGNKQFPSSPPYPPAFPPSMMWHPGMRPENAPYAYPPPSFFPYRPGMYPVSPQFPPDFMSPAVSPMNRSQAEGLMQSVIPLENQLTSLVTQGVCGAQGLQKLLDLRREVQRQLEQIMLLDLELSTSQNVELLLWRSVYQVIEMFRRYLEAKTDEYIRECLEGLIDETTMFYESLLEKLQKTYEFSLDQFLDSSRPHPEVLKRLTKLAVMSAQRVMICLGDLARYREQTHLSSNFGKAKSWYQKAQQVYPKNGRPFYQLAVLALSTKHKIDAIYYYVRSLATSNPVLTARESMATLFEETNKKASEAYEKKKRDGKEKKAKVSEMCAVEIWISSDGTMSENSITSESELAEAEELNKLSGTELNKLFVMSYLNVHGKLFSKIGMETFRESEVQMLREFNALLHHSPLPVSDFRLLQLMAINMFSVENAISKEGVISETNRPVHVMRAVQTTLDMFGLILARMTELARSVKQCGKPQLPLGEDLRTLLPSAKIWSDWMLSHLVLWNPPPQLPSSEMSSRIGDVWQSIADLCNILKDIVTDRVELRSAAADGFIPLLLPEDVTMAGYIPLLGRPSTPVYVPASSNKEMAQDCVRIARFKTFGDYLCGIQNPLLLYKVDKNQYESLYKRPTLIESQDARQLSIGIENSTEYSDQNLAKHADKVSQYSEGDNVERIRELRGRKEELEQRKAAQLKQEAARRSVLECAQQQVLEVRPNCLVPDTNCFINHLPELELLLSSSRFKIVVPLIVITELDGLARGAREGQFDSEVHARKVSAGAVAAVKFLDEKFKQRIRHLWAMTSDFNFLDTIAYRHEHSHKQEKNDDVILSICLSFCEDKSLPDPDVSNRLLRTVVLLTDDRNLSVKARSNNIPVRDIGSFMKWTKLSM